MNQPDKDEHSKSVVEAFVAEYKNQHDWDCVDTYIAENCKLHLPIPGLPPGREGMRANGEMMCTAFPDVHVTREFAVVQNGIVVERAHAKATHRAPLMGVPTTNKPVTWTELHAYRVEGDLITEIWTEADFLGVLVQIGAVEMPAL